jgi:hypothetical protein
MVFSFLALHIARFSVYPNTWKYKSFRVNMWNQDASRMYCILLSPTYTHHIVTRMVFFLFLAESTVLKQVSSKIKKKKKYPSKKPFWLISWASLSVKRSHLENCTSQRTQQRRYDYTTSHNQPQIIPERLKFNKTLPFGVSYNGRTNPPFLNPSRRQNFSRTNRYRNNFFLLRYQNTQRIANI